MPLTKENYEQFYLGNAAEYKIMSEIFFNGLEAHKMDPDIGIDILVTNIADCKFRDKEMIKHHLQIKSTFLIDGIAKFYINKTELDYLKSSTDVSTVFCYITPLIQATAKSYDRGDCEPWSEELDAMGDEFMFHNNFTELKKKGCLSQIDFKGFETNYIWLNNAQLKKLIAEKLINPLYDDLHCLRLKLNEDNHITIIDSESNEEVVIPEVQNLYYIFNYSRNKDRLEGGDFLFSHY